MASYGFQHDSFRSLYNPIEKAREKRGKKREPKTISRREVAENGFLLKSFI